MVVDYEECRRQRLEENKKRMEELNLHKLALSVTKSPSKTPKHSPVKKMRVKPETPVPVRRSSRMADKPLPSYREEPVESFRERGRRVYSYQRRDLANRVYASYEARTNAEDRAIAWEAELGSEFPSCIKPMLQSHVTGGFWLSLPLPFCQDNLPNHDAFLTLVDEEEGEWETKYLVAKNGLSGGWRGFAMDHELVDGDCLIFQLIRPNTLKVYVCRVNSPGTDEDEDNQNECADEEGPEDNKKDQNDTKSRARKRIRTDREARVDEDQDDAKDAKYGKMSRNKTKKDEGVNENQADAPVANLKIRRSSRLNKGR